MASPLLSCPLPGSETLRYRVRGSGPLKLVLIHGLAARAETWTDLIPLFPPDRYTLYLLDLLGSGESDKPRTADYSIRAHARRLLRFLELEGLSGAATVGHSLGGAIVLMAAIEATESGNDHIMGPVVVMAGPGFVQRLPLIAKVFQRPLTGPLFIALPVPVACVKIGLRAAYFDQRLVDREHLDRYAPCYRDREAKRALVQTCRTLVPADCDSICASYRHLRLPILLLWGQHDQIVPLSQGIRLKETIPGARLEVIEECGHNPQEEKPEETFDVIDRFISSGGCGGLGSE